MRCTLGGLWILLVASLAARPGLAAGDWTSATSKHFVLAGNASERDIRQVAIRLEQFREVFSRLFGKADLRTSAPVRVLVLRNDAAYQPFRPLWQGKAVATAGFFQAARDVHHIALSAEAGDANPYEVILHEYVHLLLHENARVVPLWFAEGLAEYYSTFKVLPGEKRVELGAAIGRHLATLRDGKLLPLAELFPAGHDSRLYNEQEKQGVFYAQSWALVHYLLLGKNQRRQPKVGHFIRKLAEGAPAVDSFRGIFETSYRDMEEELAQYVTRGEFYSQILTLDQRLQFDRNIKAAPLSEAQAQFYCGDLLLHMQRSQEAETYLTKAVQLDPNLPAARGALAMLRAAQNRPDEAKREIDRAVAANPKDYLLLYYRAAILSGAASDEIKKEEAATIRADLAASIELAPGFTESYNLLAWFNLVSGDQIEESIELLEHALTRYPGRQELLLTLGQLYLKLGDWQEALTLIEPLSAAGAVPELRARARSLVSEIRESAGLGPLPAAGESTSEQNSRSEDRSADNNVHPATIEEGEQIRGLLVEILCVEKQMTLVVQAQDRTLSFRTNSPDLIQFTSYTPEVVAQIKCGRRTPPSAVMIRYRKTDLGGSDGEPLAVDFVEPER